MLIYLRLLKESFGFAMNALRNNKLRTFLSLLGVTIGIFSIIAVFAAVDSLDRKIRKDLSSLDKNMISLMKMSFGPSDIPDWKREQFPQMKYDEYEYLKGAVSNTEEMAFQLWVARESIKYESKTVTDVNVVPISYEFLNIQKLEFDQGRYYNESESNSGAPVVVLGYENAKALFENADPIGKKVRMYGQRLTVIGVLKKEGASAFSMGGGNDTSAFIPVNFIRRMYGDNNKTFMSVILIKPVKGVDMEAYKAELTQKLRNYRGLKPEEVTNFFLNVLSGFTDMIDSFISVLNFGGAIIAGFSLLVGGFGVANIMFVSVKERTNLIGIQKSLGAKNKFILLQFLFEAVILCLLGGAVGIFLVWALTVMLTKLLDFEFVLSVVNITWGVGIAACIGLVSGILPAVSAARLDPVEAIRSGM